MPASPADSAIYGKLFGDAEVGQLFTDSAEVRAMMLVEGALAKVQGELGLIPEISARAIHRASMELQLDPSGLGTSVASNAVPVPEFVAMFRAAMQAPEHAAWLHWGATSQDIMDTGQALRLRQALAILDTRLSRTAKALATLAETHAATPMVARTYGQAAVVTSFGAVVASWGAPLLRHRARLRAVREDVQIVSLSGAAGTLSAMGDRGPKVRAALAEALGLRDPQASWHSERDGIAALAGWLAGVAGSLGKMGEDLLTLTLSGLNEVRLGAGGGSSTMPQKSNPVLPSVLSALARQTAALNGAIQSALPHRQQRDAAAWLTEWMSLPQLVILSGRALAIAEELAQTLTPDESAMRAQIEATGGMIFAEALSFALAAAMPRPDAQAASKMLVGRAKDTGRSLGDIAREAHPGLDLSAVFDPSQQLGTAPAEARAFAKAARSEA
ncbi:adenylosuccinate lyase family protein [Silicimonas algicola]|uniref:3-carboxy-cis,cis-muconate cycloisomerase n=1 Tax=Silicimonas algicola TaxID=1826607 RepID=A0A316G595_9RHOB|nr:adenylosuccinate lyase family protein [Silicimonas algicola]AZQ68799.1 adenylosuccinate lyase family protein [Silicimonas algicola]PWK56121.1 3-carboxy-cis,cis-muconate cycloisomerase [Silicimonas algicola]